MKCTECETELNAEEAESPRVDEENHILCDRCFKDKYSHLCPLCEETFDKDFSEKISPKHILITEYAAKNIGLNPGIYEITSYPWFADGMIEIQIYESAIKKIAELPGDFNEGDFVADIHYVCEDCAEKEEAKPQK